MEKKKKMASETETAFCFSSSRCSIALPLFARKSRNRERESLHELNAPVGNISLTNATASKRSSSNASGFLCRRWVRSTPLPMLDDDGEALSFPTAAADASLAFSCCCLCDGAAAAAASVAISAGSSGREAGERERAPSFC